MQTAEQKLATARRNARIIEMRRNGTHWADIAHAVGLSMSRCHEIFEQYRRDIPQSVAAAYREEELDLLGRGIMNLLRIAESDTESGRTRVEAWKEARQHSESRRKLLGLDAPIKRELEVIDTTSEDARLRAEITEMQNEARAAGWTP